MANSSDFDADLVILDEAHYLGDIDRGVVWEEVMIYLPERIRLLMLSATILLFPFSISSITGYTNLNQKSNRLSAKNCIPFLLL